MATAINDPPTDEQRLSDTFAALASETRRKMLQRLASGEASVNELAEPFDMSLPAISKHLKVLENAGLVTRSQRAQYRPCNLNPAPLIEVASWAERHREIWEARFDRMDSYLQELQDAGAAGPSTESANQSATGSATESEKRSADRSAGNSDSKNSKSNKTEHTAKTEKPNEDRDVDK